MKVKGFLSRWVLAILVLLLTDCTPRPETVTPPAAVKAVEATNAPAAVQTPTLSVKAQEREVMQILLDVCADVQPGQACLVEGPVVVEAQPGQKLKPFKKTGDIIRLDALQRMKVGGPGSTGGVVWLSIPGDTPGEVFKVTAFGDVELTNNVPYGSPEFAAMQSLSFNTGEAEDYDQAISRGLMVDAPHDGTLNTLVINGVEMVFGSTALLTNMGGFLSVNTISGAVGLSLPGLDQVVEGGNYYNVPREYTAGNGENSAPLAPLTDDQLAALEWRYGVDYRNILTPDKILEERYRQIVEEANRLIQAKQQYEAAEQAESAPPAPLTDEQWNALESYYGRSLRDIITPETVSKERYNKLRELADKILRGERIDEEREPSVEDRLNQYAAERIKRLMDELKRKLEEKKRMKAWKGGWWKMTYGPSTVSGSCLTEAVGDGAGGGGDGDYYTTEVPICRGNNGRTILMYENGDTFERVSPNHFVSGWKEEIENYGTKTYVTSGRYQSLQVLSPTRMRLDSVSSEAGGCTSTHSIYLDFLRDDPAIRCGKIIDAEPEPWETPSPVPTVETPQPPLPPVKGPYSVRLGLIQKDCDVKAKEALPDFLKAGGADVQLNTSQDGALLMETHAGSYLLALGPAFDYNSMRDDSYGSMLGLYTLEQPVDETYGLTLTLMQVSAEQFGGSWQVYSQDGEQYCTGSLDLMAQKK